MMFSDRFGNIMNWDCCPQIDLNEPSYIDVHRLLREEFRPEKMGTIDVGTLRGTLVSFPEADVQEVRHGKFISAPIVRPNWRGVMQIYFQPNSCSCCHAALSGKENYCPNCGAKMDLE